MIYLDYNSTAPYSSSVKEYIQNNLINDWANASSEHEMGQMLAQKVQRSRLAIASFLNVSGGSLFFTSGATESINMALSPINLKENNIQTIISSPLEHHATLDCLKHLEKSGFKIKFARPTPEGGLDPILLEKLISENPNSLISLLFVNNETGVITPIKEISTWAKKFNSLIHMDGVQALGKTPFDLEDLEVDFASFSGHKIGSFKGIGLIYAKNPKKLKPLIFGGGQEKGIRPGTYNFSAIKSLELAIEDINFDKINTQEKLRDFLESELIKLNPKIQINGSAQNRIYNTTNVYLGGIDSREVLLTLSRNGIMVSTGSACSSGSVEPSHVITTMSGDKNYARSCLRISISPDTIKEDIEKLISSIKEAI